MLSNPPYYSPNHINYRDHLVQLNLLPTSYRREILDLTFFLKSLHHKTTFKIEDHVKFQSRPIGARTRNVELNTRLVTSTYKLESTANFYPYRLTKIWNALPQYLQTSLRHLSEPLVIKQFLVPFYRAKLMNQFDPEDTCTWITWCGCSRCS